MTPRRRAVTRGSAARPWGGRRMPVRPRPPDGGRRRGRTRPSPGRSRSRRTWADPSPNGRSPGQAVRREAGDRRGRRGRGPVELGPARRGPTEPRTGEAPDTRRLGPAYRPSSRPARETPPGGPSSCTCPWVAATAPSRREHLRTSDDMGERPHGDRSAPLTSTRRRLPPPILEYFGGSRGPFRGRRSVQWTDPAANRRGPPPDPRWEATRATPTTRRSHRSVVSICGPSDGQGRPPRRPVNLNAPPPHRWSGNTPGGSRRSGRRPAIGPVDRSSRERAKPRDTRHTGRNRRRSSRPGRETPPGPPMEIGAHPPVRCGGRTVAS